MDTIFVVNAGSSSVKFEVFGASRDLPRLFRGQVDGIGTHPHLKAKDERGNVLVDQDYSTTEINDAASAQTIIGRWIDEHLDAPPIAIGHRVVHGGPDFDRPVLVDDAVLEKLERYVPLAPLHQPSNIGPIRSIRARRPDVPQVACFDTAFHRTHPALADYFAIPRALHDEGIRRYGFHGLSYEYVARRLPQSVPHLAYSRLLIAHLGSGASMCALQDGRSMDSTMGFTALDGLPMGSRPGLIDPGVLLYLMSKGMGPTALRNFLYHDCGLKGLSGISNDVRDLLASDDRHAVFALEFFAYRIAQAAGALTSSLNGIDGFIFTAGIGENAAPVRAAVCERLGWLGIELDEAANDAPKSEDGLRKISAPSSKVEVYVVPTDEEAMIAEHTLDIVETRR